MTDRRANSTCLQSPLSGKRALVWGACGFIGDHLVSRLVREGAKVSVLTFDRRRYAVPGWAGDVEWFELNNSAADAAILAEAIECAEIIYNLAGSSGAVASNREPIASLDSICRAQLQMLQAVQLAGNRPHMVFASSRLVYGQPSRMPVDENTPAAPQSMYAAHKWCVEKYHEIFAAQEALTFTVCRITNPYGSTSTRKPKAYGFINNLISQGLDGMPLTIYGNGSQLRDYLHISDLVDALLLSGYVSAAVNQVFNIGRGDGISILDAAEQIRAATKGGALRFLHWPAEYAAVESGDFVADIAKAHELLGYRPQVDFESGLRCTVLEERARREIALVAKHNDFQERRKLGAGRSIAAFGGDAKLD